MIPFIVWRKKEKKKKRKRQIMIRLWSFVWTRSHRVLIFISLTERRTPQIGPQETHVTGGIQYGLKRFAICHQRQRRAGMRWTLLPNQGWKWFRDPSSCGVSAADRSCHGWIRTTNRQSCSSEVGGLTEKLHCTWVTPKRTASPRTLKGNTLKSSPR